MFIATRKTYSKQEEGGKNAKLTVERCIKRFFTRGQNSSRVSEIENYGQLKVCVSQNFEKAYYSPCYLNS
jgi:hypothetical protein